MAKRLAVIVMGVSGSGKSTLGAALAGQTGAVFLEGDSFHPAQNVAAMAAGQPLNDEMRAPWLAALGAAGADELSAGRDVVLTCSALKRAYRDQLRAKLGGCRFFFLNVPQDVLAKRLSQRQGHYMPASLLASQLAALEVPEPDEQDCHHLPGDAPQADLLAMALHLMTASATV